MKKINKKNKQKRKDKDVNMEIKVRTHTIPPEIKTNDVNVHIAPAIFVGVIIGVAMSSFIIGFTPNAPANTYGTKANPVIYGNWMTSVGYMMPVGAGYYQTPEGIEYFQNAQQMTAFLHKYNLISASQGWR